MTARTLLHRHPARRDDIGDLQTRRPLPGPGLPHLDLFLFLNHHGPQVYPPHNAGLPFGPHPHRGFETVTFILSGSLAHRDSGGHESVIEAGGIQWMTAGSGLVHAELSPAAFKRDGGDLEILQLWVNLPARLKFTPPAYHGVSAADLPLIEADDGRVRLHLASGSHEGIQGAVATPTPITLMTVEIAPGGRVTLPAPAGNSVFCYGVRGTVQIAGQDEAPWQLFEFADDGDHIEIGSRDGAVLLYGHAAPFAEPIVAHGPFVMNSAEEIRQAIRDYQAGLFGDVPE
ncbi:pirin family protein [Pseudomonas oryzihabitans]|uniref:pirin family protein n=1 Tax=Pseudomonas oryzihabitans TaxID=47885 RepID=UPI0028ACF50E|nr:pirin family protein [Pseudomonas oryzihabitans]